MSTPSNFLEVPPATLPKATKVKIKTKSKKGKERERDQGNGDNDGDKIARPKTPPPADEYVARRAMRHFIAGQLHTAGFSSASAPILDEIERNAVQCEPPM